MDVMATMGDLEGGGLIVRMVENKERRSLDF